jgi:hypothetical protein
MAEVRVGEPDHGRAAAAVQDNVGHLGAKAVLAVGLSDGLLPRQHG